VKGESFAFVGDVVGCYVVTSLYVFAGSGRTFGNVKAKHSQLGSMN
jgi:hypothetical protein